jgi:hypothetical protein
LSLEGQKKKTKEPTRPHTSIKDPARALRETSERERACFVATCFWASCWHHE